jgi:hypothetical protein
MKIKLLRSRGACGHRPRRCVGNVAGLLATGLSAVLLLSLSTGALAAQRSNVVPPTGKVAGRGYAYWMERHWQFSFSLSASAARSSNLCHTLTANGKQVAWLIGPSTGNHACSEPVGRPIYVNLLGAECSTFSGDHPGFGTSDAQLQACSRSQFAGAGLTPSATVDGQAVNVKALVTATGAFPVHAVGGNPLGFPAGNGRSAAYGIGLLLTGFSKGTHTIHCIVQGSSEENVTWTVHVS